MAVATIVLVVTAFRITLGAHRMVVVTEMIY
jgi:hypothetical protein